MVIPMSEFIIFGNEKKSKFIYIHCYINCSLLLYKAFTIPLYNWTI